MTDPKDNSSDDDGTPEPGDLHARNLEMLRMHLRGHDDDEIGAHFKISSRSVRRIAKQMQWKAIRLQISRRQVNRVVATTLAELEAEQTLSDAGIRRDEQGRLFFEVIIQVPVGAFHASDGSDWGLIPPPVNAANRVITVSANPATGQIVKRYYLQAAT